MKKDGAELLEQLIKSLKDAGEILNEAYNQNDSQKFNKAKKIILQIQDKILEIV